MEYDFFKERCYDNCRNIYNPFYKNLITGNHGSYSWNDDYSNALPDLKITTYIRFGI